MQNYLKSSAWLPKSAYALPQLLSVVHCTIHTSDSKIHSIPKTSSLLQVANIAHAHLQGRRTGSPPGLCLIPHTHRQRLSTKRSATTRPIRLKKLKIPCNKALRGPLSLPNCSTRSKLKEYSDGLHDRKLAQDARFNMPRRLKKGFHIWRVTELIGHECSVLTRTDIKTPTMHLPAIQPSHLSSTQRSIAQNLTRPSPPFPTHICEPQPSIPPFPPSHNPNPIHSLPSNANPKPHTRAGPSSPSPFPSPSPSPFPSPSPSPAPSHPPAPQLAPSPPLSRPRASSQAQLDAFPRGPRRSCGGGRRSWWGIRCL